MLRPILKEKNEARYTVHNIFILMHFLHVEVTGKDAILHDF